MATSRVVPMKMTQMMVAQISKPGADFEIVEREIPKPDAGHVRIKVQACGICHSDVLTKDGIWRSEERRVGKECRTVCRSRWSPYH